METSPLPHRPSLNYHLFRNDVPDALRHTIVDISRAAKYISYYIQTTEAGLLEQENQFGEQQMALDVQSDELVCRYLRESNMVNSYISEEQAEVFHLREEAPYAVVFDPLDGSSLVDANFSIGSIFGIYETDSLIGRTPAEQVAALYVLYGPRTILVYSTGKGVHQFLLNDVGEYVLLEENMQVQAEATHYSPGNLRALEDNKGYQAALDYWLQAQMTLRYSGCMVADIHHILAKGQGVFTNIGGAKYPEGKLRLPFECGPFAYLIEQAGGAASDGSKRILDKPIEHIDQRTPIIIGSKDQVTHVAGLLRNA